MSKCVEVILFSLNTKKNVYIEVSFSQSYEKCHMSCRIIEGI